MAVKDLKKKADAQLNCSIADCDEKVFVSLRGWCKGHYLRWYRHGDPLGGKFFSHHGMKNTPIHNAWINIKSRVYNPKNQYYHLYGGRGIKMYSGWKDNFMAFHEYIINNLGERPDGMSIDRINNDGDYEPGNVRWATPTLQAINTRNPITNTSGYRGVKWKKRLSKWEVAIRANGKDIYVGLFDDKEAAALAYDCAAIQFYGDSSTRNII